MLRVVGKDISDDAQIKAMTMLLETVRGFPAQEAEVEEAIEKRRLELGYDLKAQLMEENISYHGIDFSDISELELAILQDHIDGKWHNGRKWTVAEIVAVYYEGDAWETFFK